MIRLQEKFICACSYCYKESRIKNNLATEFEPIIETDEARSILCPLRKSIKHEREKVQEPNPPEDLGEEI